MTDHSINKNEMPRTKKQNEEIRREAKNSIMNNSLILFGKKGFHGTSISDIAKKSGISKGLIYNYFDGKENILDSILERFFKETEEITSPPASKDDPYEQLQSIIDESFLMLKEREEEWRFLSALMIQPGISKNAERLSRSFFKILVERIQKIFRKVGIKNSKEEAYIFAAMIDGTILYFLLDKDNYPLDKVVKQLKKRYSREELQGKITS